MTRDSGSWHNFQLTIQQFLRQNVLICGSFSVATDRNENSFKSVYEHTHKGLHGIIKIRTDWSNLQINPGTKNKHLYQQPTWLTKIEYTINTIFYQVLFCSPNWGCLGSSLLSKLLVFPGHVVLHHFPNLDFFPFDGMVGCLQVCPVSPMYSTPHSQRML